ncbi:MAG: STAS domain-containing protein [Planctomycetota bacterium]|nr:STAS domain-containing protein [Planctomycetota bacterium]
MTSRNVGDIVVAGFEEAKMLDEAVINEVADELNALVDQNEGGKLLLDFGTISFMSSSMIGKVVFLEKACKKKNVTMKICSINPSVMEVFNLMNLGKVLDLYDDGEAAIAAFG